MKEKNTIQRLKSLGLVFMLSLLVACVNDDRDESSTSIDEVAMMVNIADNIILKGYQAVKDEVELLVGAEGAVQNYCAAIDTGSEVESLTTLRNQWKNAMDAWQQAEVWTVGPASANGADLRNRIYAYDENAKLSSCGADQAIVQAQQDGFNISARAVNHRGLLVLEYLLFNEDLDHTCPTQVAETQDWNARTSVQRKQWRCEYAKQVSDDVLAAVDSIINAWQSTGGNYRTTFLNPQNYEQSLNDLSDALFYLDTHTKDLKLGVPLSLNDICSQVNCADAVESIYSRHSLHNILNNLIGFRAVFTGSEGLGFDDLIASKGYSSTSQDILGDIEAAVSASNYAIEQAGVNGLSGYADNIVDVNSTAVCANAVANPSVSLGRNPACDLYGLLKRVSDHLKTDFVTIVNLDLPERAQSDND